MDDDERVDLAQRLLRTLGGYYDDQAFCFSLIPDAAPEEVLMAYGGDPTDPTAVWGDDESIDLWPRPHVVLIPVDGAVIAIEDNQWEGVRPEVMRRLSKGRRAAGLYRNVNMANRLALFDDGDELICEEVACHEQIPPHLEAYFAGVDVEAEPVDGAPYETCGWSVANVTAMERFTGRRFDGPPPPTGLLVHRIEPWPEEDYSPGDTSVLDDTERDVLRLPGYREGTALLGVDGFLRLVESVRQATAAQRRQVIARVVWWSLQESEWSLNNHNVADQLDRLSSLFELAALAEEVRAARRAAEANPPYVWAPPNDAQSAAWATMIYAGYPDTGQAALQVLLSAAPLRAAHGPGVDDWLHTWIADTTTMA